MKTKQLSVIEQGQLKADVPDFRVGDRVEVHQRILDKMLAKDPDKRFQTASDLCATITL